MFVDLRNTCCTSWNFVQLRNQWYLKGYNDAWNDGKGCNLHACLFWWNFVGVFCYFLHLWCLDAVQHWFQTRMVFSCLHAICILHLLSCTRVVHNFNISFTEVVHDCKVSDFQTMTWLSFSDCVILCLLSKFRDIIYILYTYKVDRPLCSVKSSSYLIWYNSFFIM